MSVGDDLAASDNTDWPLNLLDDPSLSDHLDQQLIPPIRGEKHLRQTQFLAFDCIECRDAFGNSAMRGPEQDVLVPSVCRRETIPGRPSSQSETGPWTSKIACRYARS